MERNPDFHYEHLDLLVIDLGEKCIESLVDCGILFEEAESIAEDFPGYLVVFKV